MTLRPVDQSRFLTLLLYLLSGTTSLLLVAFAVAALLTGYYAQACTPSGGGWGLLVMFALLLIFPYVTVPVWLALAFALAKGLRPVQSVKRYFMILLASLPLALILFGLSWLFAVMTGAVARCSFGF